MGRRGKRKFIAGAIRHPGELKHYAASQNCLTASGHVDLRCVGSHIIHIHDPQRRRHLMRALNLARILHRLRPVKHR